MGIFSSELCSEKNVRNNPKDFIDDLNKST
jgi:hypothetical protein